jgi:hypothetical protein
MTTQLQTIQLQTIQLQTTHLHHQSNNHISNITKYEKIIQDTNNMENINNTNNINQYNLNTSVFDPFKGSPPKTFMIKLHMRMKNYNLGSLGINDINRNSE